MTHEERARALISRLNGWQPSPFDPVDVELAVRDIVAAFREVELAARPALELPTRDELARFLSQETEGDAWDDPLHDEHQERFRNAWRKKANRILAFLAPKPPEGRSDD
jgi:hypothetical protein